MPSGESPVPLDDSRGAAEPQRKDRATPFASRRRRLHQSERRPPCQAENGPRPSARRRRNKVTHAAHGCVPPAERCICRSHVTISSDLPHAQRWWGRFIWGMVQSQNSRFNLTQKVKEMRKADWASAKWAAGALQSYSRCQRPTGGLLLQIQNNVGTFGQASSPGVGPTLPILPCAGLRGDERNRPIRAAA